MTEQDRAHALSVVGWLRAQLSELRLPKSMRVGFEALLEDVLAQLAADDALRASEQDGAT